MRFAENALSPSRASPLPVAVLPHFVDVYTTEMVEESSQAYGSCQDPLIRRPEQMPSEVVVPSGDNHAQKENACDDPPGREGEIPKVHTSCRMPRCAEVGDGN